jgi:GTPase SAR1 family protein
MILPLVFILMFSVGSHASYIEVAQKFIYEVRKSCPSAACILVGARADLRTNECCKKEVMQRRQRMLSNEDGEYLAKRSGCLAYFEISSLFEEGLDDLKNAILIAKTIRSKETKTCCIQ